MNEQLYTGYCWRRHHYPEKQFTVLFRDGKPLIPIGWAEDVSWQGNPQYGFLCPDCRAEALGQSEADNP